MSRNNVQERFYPLHCQSAYCGKIECPADCPNKPALDEFNQWEKEHKAVQSDWIWNPTHYIATC